MTWRDVALTTRKRMAAQRAEIRTLRAEVQRLKRQLRQWRSLAEDNQRLK